MAEYSPWEVDFFFSCLRDTEHCLHYTRRHLSVLLYWHQLVLYYIFWDSLCAIINIPGYHSNQHLFNIYVGNELKIHKKKKKTKKTHATKSLTPRKNPNQTARFLQDKWEYLTWHKEKAYKNNLSIRLAHIKYVQGFWVLSDLITEPQIR